MIIKIAENAELNNIFALRLEVFVNEQKVPPEIELDEHDTDALHIIAKEGGIAVGCARVILSENDAHIGRLAVKKLYRGKGIGSEICRYIIEYCREKGYDNIWLNSQLHAVEFYEKLGFMAHGQVFEEAGIMHTKMVLCHH